MIIFQIELVRAEKLLKTIFSRVLVRAEKLLNNILSRVLFFLAFYILKVKTSHQINIYISSYNGNWKRKKTTKELINSYSNK